MSVYAFDLDGVLDRPPMRGLANDLFDAGHTILVVTGGLSDSGEWSESARISYLQGLGVHYTRLIRCIAPDYTAIGRLKGEACQENAAAVLFDDSIDYLRAASQVSRTQKVLVL